MIARMLAAAAARMLAAAAARMLAAAAAVSLAAGAAPGPVLAQSAPPLLWQWPMPSVLPLAVEPDRRGRPVLYVAQKAGGVAVLGLGGAQPTPLATVSRSALGGLDAMHLAQHGDTLLVALGDHFAAGGARAGLALVSVADPRAPAMRAIWVAPNAGHGASAVATDGRHAYLGAMREGVIVFDLAAPGALRPLAAFRPDPNFPRANPGGLNVPAVRGVTLVGRLLFVAYDAGGLRVLDVAQPARPVEIGRYSNPAMGRKPQPFNAVAVDGRVAYVSVDYCGVETLDISDPRRPRALGWWNPWRCETLANNWFNSAGHANHVAFDPARRRLYVSAGDTEMAVLDMADPARPRLVESIGQPRDGLGAWGLGLAARAVYVAYIRAPLPFRGTWSGLRAFQR
jgi:hypothetical protein